MKKVNLQISLWFIAISCVLIVSCSKEENEPQLILSPESEMLFTNGIIFPAEGGEQSISFTIMNQTWWNSQIIPTNSSEWCTVEYKYNFEQSNEVRSYIHVAENAERNERNAQFVIKVGDTQKSLNIKQEGTTDFIQLSEKRYEISHVSTAFQIEVLSNCNYAIEIAPEGQSWIYNKEGNLQYHPGKQVITFFASENEKTSPRECKIAFKSENNLEQIEIYQAAKPALTLSENGSKAQIDIQEAGKLPEILSTTDLTKIKDLTLIGYINGSDFVTMEKMSNLTHLDLSHANIRSGGDSYQRINNDIDYFTKDNEITDYLFFNWKKLEHILLPEQVKSIGECAFEKCINLKTINISNSVKNIGAYAFCECIVLEDIHLPETLTKIEDSTFALCRNLSAITIPQNVTHIGRWAFGNCSRLRHVIIKGKTMPTITPTSFFEGTGTSMEDIAPLRFFLIIPKGCEEDYQNNSIWMAHAIAIFEE